jgi:hypothetical protein
MKSRQTAFTCVPHDGHTIVVDTSYVMPDEGRAFFETAARWDRSPFIESRPWHISSATGTAPRRWPGITNGRRRFARTACPKLLESAVGSGHRAREFVRDRPALRDLR